MCGGGWFVYMCMCGEKEVWFVCVCVGGRGMFCVGRVVGFVYMCMCGEKGVWFVCVEGGGMVCVYRVYVFLRCVCGREGIVLCIGCMCGGKSDGVWRVCVCMCFMMGVPVCWR